MTLVVDILGRAARECSVPPPSSWASATGQTHLEILDFMDQTASTILDRVDLPSPMSEVVALTGDGMTLDFPLPGATRLKRGKLSVYEQGLARRELVPVSTDGEWQALQDNGSTGATRFYRLQGYEGALTLSIYRPLGAAETVLAWVMNGKWINRNGAYEATFADEADVSMLPRKVMEAGIVWRFRQRKGLEYGDKLAEFEAMLGRMSNDATPRRAIAFGSTPVRGPWDIPVPDFIPNA
jgi:hypothetical protein